MSVCTILWVNVKYTPEDIKDALETLVDEPKGKAKKVECVSTHTPIMSQLIFKYNGEKRMMSIFSPCSSCPLGPVMSLSMGAGGGSSVLMRDIAKRIGGILQTNDCDEKYEVIHGVAWEEDGLSYFLKYGILRGQVNGRSVPQLKKVVADWEAEVNRSGSNRMEL